MGFPTEHWISEQDCQAQDYSDYWNEESHERGKAWNVLDGEFSAMERYLEQKRLPQDLQACVEALPAFCGHALHGTGIDIAAGNLWAVPHLVNFGAEKVYCLEYSQHRLLKIGPRVLEHYGVPAQCATLVFGSFYDLKLADASLDFVFMSQALHHAASVDDLLSEIRRVLRPGGVVLVIGEKIIRPWRSYTRHFMKRIVALACPARLQQRIFGQVIGAQRWFPTLQELHPPHSEMGDHHYSLKQYDAMFAKFGFRYAVVSTKNACAAFILQRDQL